MSFHVKSFFTSIPAADLLNILHVYIVTKKPKQDANTRRMFSQNKKKTVSLSVLF